MGKSAKTLNHQDRYRLLRRIENAASIPLSILGFVWLLIVIAGFIWRPVWWIQTMTYVIWAIFVIDFIIRLTIAPHKLTFLESNILLAVSLLLPAFGMFQFLRFFAVVPAWGAALLRLVASVHRSTRILGATMHRRGLAYVLLLTAIATCTGAAGMYAFERNPHGGPGINSYGDAIWWTSMVMTTLGSDYFPHTIAGRILCFLLSVFAFSIFGYVTAAISSYFINRDADDKHSDVPSAKQLNEILAEVRDLRAVLERGHPAPPSARPSKAVR